MAQTPHVPSDPQVPDESSISKKAARRRVAIASGLAAGAAFIAAGLLAGPSVFPGVLDELRERDLLPVHVIGSGGTATPGPEGSSGAPGASSGGGASGGAGSNSGGSGGGPGVGGPGSVPSTNHPPAPSVILPGGIDLKDVLEDATDGVEGTVENAKGFLKETVGCVTGNPTNAPGCVVDGAKDLIDKTTSTLLPDLGVTIPTVPTVPGVTVPDLPVTIPTVPVTVPTTPTVTAPPITTPTVPTVPITTPTVPATAPSVPVTAPTSSLTVPTLSVPTVTVPPVGGLL